MVFLSAPAIWHARRSDSPRWAFRCATVSRFTADQRRENSPPDRFLIPLITIFDSSSFIAAMSSIYLAIGSWGWGSFGCGLRGCRRWFLVRRGRRGKRGCHSLDLQ